MVSPWKFKAFVFAFGLAMVVLTGCNDKASTNSSTPMSVEEMKKKAPPPPK